MTAINLLCTGSAVHLFADGGHFDPAGRLHHLGNKIYPLPAYNAVMAFSGPSDAALRLLGRIERSGCGSLRKLLNDLPSIANALPIPGAWSLIVVGIYQGQPIGRTVEETGKSHPLGPGSTLRSLSSTVAFGYPNIVGSGLAMMEDQRARHGVVGGWCQYTVLDATGWRQQMLCRWPDHTRAAKIADLEVDRINIKYGAVNAYESHGDQLGDLTISGWHVGPVQVSAEWTAQYIGTASSSNGVTSCSITRLRGGLVLVNFTDSFSGNNSQTRRYSQAGIDYEPQDSDVYRFQIAGNGGFSANLLVSGVECGALYQRR